MKIPLGILAVVAISLLTFQLFAPNPGPDAMKPRTDLPWQITVNPDGSSRVFDIELGSATLADAMAKFGGIEGLALFEPKNGAMVLEAYFGSVQFGPLKARVITGLKTADGELDDLRKRAINREGSPSGDWKYPLDDSPELHHDRPLTVVTYIPGTRNLDRDFFRSRFGEPDAWLQESETAASWFYPRLGLAVLIDETASEVLEYQPPRDFIMPSGVTLNPGAH